ncbi:ABC transporter substrate-binding protein, partial [Jatrophihabitans endophyticus]|uniref:ABC transporter substrate-binding protein n=1 Tax=Jatrophihabitans endophyticus TaxID=1206085 RepID=UPI001A058A8E|nr:hypothetical protein [Jatrophihabitans endophyticus]
MGGVSAPTDTDRPSGIDLQWVDSGVRAQDDLYAHVNGVWIAEHEIPADRPIDGSFLTLRDRAEEDVRDIVVECAGADAAPGSDTQRIGDLYTSFMDTDRIESLGLDPIRADLDRVAGITSTEELAEVIGELQRRGSGGAIGFYVDTDSKKSDRYLVHLGQSGIGLPDESYYREDKHAETRSGYVAHIERMFALVGFDDAATRAATVLDLETALASHHWDVVKRRDADLTYNLLTHEELASSAGAFDVAAWLRGLGVIDDAVFAEVVVRQPSFVDGLGALVADRPLTDWIAWLQWRLVHSAAPYLTSAIVDENFAFYGRTLSGTPEIRERWKRGVGLVEAAVGFAVGKLYVERHFPPAAKARMDELIANLVEAYRRNISDLDWMSPATREKALAKLDKFTPKQGASFVRFDGYWGDKALPDRTEFVFFDDLQPRVLALQGGQVDMIDQIPVAGGQALLNDPQFTIIREKSAAHEQVHMRCDTGPFADKRIRKAMALSIDRDKLVQGLFRGYAVVGNDSPFAPAFPSTDTSVPQRKQDIAQAKQLLEAAGVAKGFDVTLTTERYIEIPQYAILLQNFARPLG